MNDERTYATWGSREQFDGIIDLINDFGLDCADRQNLPWRYGEYAYGAPTPERDDLIAAIVAAIEEARAAGRREANDASAAHEGGKP